MTAASDSIRRWSRGLFNQAEPAPRIMVVDPDPYLMFLLRLDLSSAQIVNEAEVPEGDQGTVDLLLVDLSSSRASEALSNRKGAKVIGIVGRASAIRRAFPPEVDELLVRPFSSGELYRAVRRALNLPDPTLRSRPDALQRGLRYLAMARLAAAAIAGVFEMAFAPPSFSRSLVLAVAFAYAALRLRWRPKGRFAPWIDVAVAAVIPETGNGGYLAFRAVAAAEAGLFLGVGWGTFAGLVIGAASSPPILAGVVSGRSEVTQLVSWLLLYPVIAVAGGLAGYMWQVGTGRGKALLAKANRALVSFYEIARSIPGGLDPGSVVNAVMDEIKQVPDVTSAAMLYREAGVFVTPGSFGFSAEKEELLLRDASSIAASFDDKTRVLSPKNLSGTAARVLDGCPVWIKAVLPGDAVARGFLITGFQTEMRARAQRAWIEQLASDASVALENANLYLRIRELSAEEERTRLAQELHDGVAQVLTHIRLEFDLMAKREEEPFRKSEATRLTRVLDRALGEVRAMIQGLDAQTVREGLIGGLRSYMTDLQRLGGPRLTFHARGSIRLPPQVEDEAFRIAQEAISNALRHAEADEILVNLDTSGDIMSLEILDDGKGISPGAEKSGEMGVKGMKERAERIGANLSIRRREAGGTSVELTLQRPLVAKDQKTPTP